MPEILSAIGVIVVLVLVMFLAYYATKWLGKKHMVQGGSSRNMEVLERIALGPDRQLMIVRVGEKHMLLGVTAQHIEFICDIAPEDLLPDVGTKPETSFSAALKNVLKNQWGINPGKGKEKPDE